MSEMIERVAKALDPLAWAIPEDDYPAERARREARQAQSLMTARKVLEAMKEATFDMLLEGQSVVNLTDTPGRYEYISRDETQEIWGTMIEEALK